MITMRELASALFGVWRLLHVDKGGLQYLDDSIAGYWKSFVAALVVLPGFVIMQLLELAVEPASVGVNWPQVVAIWAIVYVMHWTLFPIATAYITAEIGRSDQYLKFIVAHNWSSVIQIVIVVPAVAIQVLTGPEGIGVFLFLLITIGLLFFSWFIAKTSLDVPGMIAAGFVVLDVVLSLALNVVTAALTRL